MKATLSEIDTDTYYINNTWRIDQDSMNYILQKKASSEGNRWKIYGYYQTIGQLYHALVDLAIKECSLRDVKGFNDRVEELHSLIEKSASSMGGVKHEL